MMPTTYRFATAEKTVLPESRAHVFFDGIFTDPRLQHAECVAIGPDGLCLVRQREWRGAAHRARTGRAPR